MQKYTVFLFLFFVSSAVHAHDFWLAPAAYKLNQPDAVAIQFLVGHHGDVEHWDLQWKRIVSLKSHSDGGDTDMTPNIVTATHFTPGIATTPQLEAGTHVIGFESYHSFSELKAAKFNRYLKAEGLSLVSAHRASNNREEAAGTELYSRRAKTIIQVGNELSDAVLQPLGHTLEIVPLRHPGLVLIGESLPVKVLFRGKPLAGAKITVEMLNDKSTPGQFSLTDDHGKADLPLIRPGQYKFNTVWGVPLDAHPTADYETYFASLTLQR